MIEHEMLKPQHETRAHVPRIAYLEGNIFSVDLLFKDVPFVVGHHSPVQLPLAFVNVCRKFKEHGTLTSLALHAYSS